MGRKGFTLIELLVVIAIIAILAAILFPVFIRAKESARLTGCASNLRQLGKSYQLYVDDYNGTYPAGYRITAAGEPKLHPQQETGRCTWDVAIYKYSKNIKLYKCPSDVGKRPAGFSPRSYSLNDQWLWHVYVSTGVMDLTKTPNQGRWKESEVMSPWSRFVLLCEWHHSSNQSTGAIQYYNNFGNGNMYCCTADASNQKYPEVHVNGTVANFLFFDGHVTAAPFRKMANWKYWGFLKDVGSDHFHI
jgi:prepilin-type N-terminal cleavage/methylation domain-containing protein/prepilin-type processing-associated H-X9-DG protein